MTSCEGLVQAVYPHDNAEPKHNIEVHLTKKGVQVNIVDEGGELVDTVQVYREDKTLGSSIEDFDEFDPPESVEEALENVHGALLACAEFGVPLNDIFTYLLSRAAEIAYASAIPRSKFVGTCVGVYEQVLTNHTETKPVQGEA